MTLRLASLIAAYSSLSRASDQFFASKASPVPHYGTLVKTIPYRHYRANKFEE
jgi:hypothetical protein